MQELKSLEAELSRQLQSVKDKIKSFENAERDARLDDLKDLVIKAHDILCRWNHTDGCGWGYEERNGVHDWTDWSHARWLEHYDRLVNPTRYNSDKPLSIEMINKMLDWIEQVKKEMPEMVWIFRIGKLEP